MSSTTRRDASLRPRRIRLAVALAATLAAENVRVAASADAITYRVAQCSEQYGAGHLDALFTRTSSRYEGIAACRGNGLTIRHDPGPNRTPAGRSGTWAISAPIGAAIVRAGARVSAEGDGGHSPQVVMLLAGGVRQALSGVRGAAHGITWAGSGARALSSRLICTAAIDCGAGKNARIDLRGIVLTLSDVAAPSLRLSGSLFAEASRRGVQAAELLAADTGSGVRAAAIEVNGDPISARTMSCAVRSDRVATRIQPCPSSAAALFELDTAMSPFRQGRNTIRSCVSDYAPGSGANRTCESRGVRIDNLCPVSPIAGSRLSAHVERARSGEQRTTVAGRVLDAAQRPLPGARICITTRVSVHGALERIAGLDRTGEDGRYSVRLPKGPSREVRVAHWAGSERVLERFLSIQAPARPQLELAPKEGLRNGDRVSFQATLAGPGQAHKQVILEAQTGRRWIPIATGRSNSRGEWHGTYRFRHTTGSQTYRFRLKVPRQAGYPYDPGTSQTKKVRVQG